MTDKCVICGEIIPEGRQVCPNCEGEGLVGRVFKGKINGALFLVKELKKSRDDWYYIVVDIATGNSLCCSKGWFENGTMKNLEVVKGGVEK